MELQNVKLFDDNLELYSSQLADIEKAKEYIFLEVFRFNDDAMGKRYCMALAKKAQQGVKVKVLVDAWGTKQDSDFLKPIVDAGGEVRFFQKLYFTVNFISSNHRRNHRKLLVIDNHIVYMGSANISAYSLVWRELNIRIQDRMARLFKKVFLDSYAMYRKFDIDKMRFKRNIFYKRMMIMQEVPSRNRQRLRHKYESLINNAKKTVIIETPYFLPSSRLRKALVSAVRRGVHVIVAMPKNSDVQTVDIIRRYYLGKMHEQGVDIRMYTPTNLHAKCMFIDGEIFSISSANFDYRSFQHQHELALIGKEHNISKLLKKHVDTTLESCEAFDYQKWLERTKFEKFMEWFLRPLRFMM
ncbi:MAG: phosphatidylserine/phosphatidylglycerophosphate/cardiolipin synthase family protein [Bacteroidales bacterium]|nr:phosphatidylserine/phosphatidylglycerophosphate/cardiolipin synthase family protein [Bacteroidales bacterium]